MGKGIFDWVLRQNSNLRFEMVPFNSEKIDGMLYIPAMGRERAYIILNSNKPLVNQIFVAAHEFYHYEKDYQLFKAKPYICDFNMLKDVKEMRASRFAAELLLPEAALSQEVKAYLRAVHIPSSRLMQFKDYAILSIFLTVKYQMPLKAVIYRLTEEHYIDNINKYIENYDFIKKVLQEIKIFAEQVNELYDRKNNYVIPYSSTYEDMQKYGGTARELKDLSSIDIITFDIIVLSAFVYYAQENNNTYSKALKAIYKRYCADVIKRHHLPKTLGEYIKASANYL